MRFPRRDPGPAAALRVGLLAGGLALGLGPAARSDVLPALVAGGGLLKGEKLDGYGLAGVALGWTARRDTRIDLAALVLPANVTEESPFVSGLRDEIEIALELSARRYLAPDRPFGAMHVTAGLRGGALLWRYADPVRDATGAAFRGRDHLSFASLHLGAGRRLARAHGGEVVGQVLTGIRTYASETHDGLENDLVEMALFTEFRLGFGWGPR
jgi:hypothetical protein